MSATKAEYVEKHFPKVDPGAAPCGAQIMVQLRTVPSASKGGIILTAETKEFNEGNTQIAMVVKTGQIAFCNRETGKEWNEGAWAKVGDIVVIPRWSGWKFSVPIPDSNDKATFAIFNDVECKVIIEGNFEAFDTLL